MRNMSVAMLAIALAACASSPDREQASRLPEVPASGETVDSLQAQTLSAGECGLFLWTADSPRRFVFFFQAGNETADAIVDARQVRLSPTSQAGTIFGQFMTNLGFVSPQGLRVNLSMLPGELVEGGQRVSSAQMSIIDTQGWETIVPLVGVRACQPE